MKPLLLFAGALFCHLHVFSQEETSSKFRIIGTDTVYNIVDDQAYPVNGMKKFYDEIYALTKYPAQARKAGVEGRVFIEFVVDKNGSLRDMAIIRGIGAGCDEECLRVLKLVNKWVPGKVAGKAVHSKFQLAMVFKLGGVKKEPKEKRKKG